MALSSSSSSSCSEDDEVTDCLQCSVDVKQDIDKFEEDVEEFGFAIWHLAPLLLVILPLVFLCQVLIGGYCMAHMEGWRFRDGNGFAASAVTGGAIQLTGSGMQPSNWMSRIAAVVVGASGVGLYTFMIGILSTGLPDRLLNGLGIELKTSGTCALLGMLSVLVLSTVVCELLVSMVGAVLIQLTEEWSYFEAWRTLASIQLGGGIDIGQKSPESHFGRAVLMLAACSAIGFGTMLFGVTTGPWSVLLERCGLVPTRRHRITLSALGLFIFSTVLCPLGLVIAMLVTALPIWAHSRDGFEAHFWRALPQVTGGAATVYPAVTTTNLPGVLVRVFSATVGFFIVSVSLGVGTTYASPLVNALGFNKPRGKRDTILALLTAAVVLLPLLVISLSAPIGAILAYEAGWRFDDAFAWVIAAQLGGGMTLTSESPSDLAERVIGTICAAYATAVASFSLGVMSSPMAQDLQRRLISSVDRWFACCRKRK